MFPVENHCILDSARPTPLVPVERSRTVPGDTSVRKKDPGILFPVENCEQGSFILRCFPGIYAYGNSPVEFVPGQKYPWSNFFLTREFDQDV